MRVLRISPKVRVSLIAIRSRGHNNIGTPTHSSSASRPSTLSRLGCAARSLSSHKRHSQREQQRWISCSDLYRTSSLIGQLSPVYGGAEHCPPPPSVQDCRCHFRRAQLACQHGCYRPVRIICWWLHLKRHQLELCVCPSTPAVEKLSADLSAHRYNIFTFTWAMLSALVDM